MKSAVIQSCAGIGVRREGARLGGSAVESAPADEGRLRYRKVGHVHLASLRHLSFRQCHSLQRDRRSRRDCHNALARARQDRREIARVRGQVRSTLRHLDPTLASGPELQSDFCRLDESRATTIPAAMPEASSATTRNAPRTARAAPFGLRSHLLPLERLARKRTI